MTVALAFADAVMGGKVFGCFFESAGERFDRHGNPLSRDDSMDESNIAYIRIYGEGSPEAMAITGDMKRYATPLSKRDQVATFQGVSGLTKYRGRTKPGIENYYRTLQEAAYHVGARDLKTYRDKAALIRLSERAKVTARPHGIDIIGD
jgi:hypothetical protein